MKRYAIVTRTKEATKFQYLVAQSMQSAKEEAEEIYGKEEFSSVVLYEISDIEVVK